MFGLGGKIKIDRDLLKRAEEYAARKGYPSVDEFISHLLEREMRQEDEPSESEEELRKKLQGLGYIS
jgi:metal-responsive CopG/Arc/MetJ family transcriptional regulator